MPQASYMPTVRESASLVDSEKDDIFECINLSEESEKDSKSSGVS